MTLRAGAWLALLLAACEEEPPPPIVSPREAADAQVRALYAGPDATGATPSSPNPVDPTAATPTGTAGTSEVVSDVPPSASPPEAAPVAEVKLLWDRISMLHRGFFNDPVLKAALARDLAPYVVGGPEVEIGFDDVEVRGWIKLKVPPGGLRTPVRISGDLVQVQDLSPLTAALDRYRLAMGSRYDLRLLNFRVRVEVRGGGRTCVFAPAGDPPPDGKILSPCVSVGAEALCGEPSLEGVRFSAADSAVVRACLGGS